VPTDANSERAWKESIIKMYRQQMKELEDQLNCDDESYAEKLSTSERKSLCKEAIQQLRNQVNDILAKCWIEDNLVDDVVFEFTTLDGRSKFGDSKLLYSTPIFNESLLLTALSQVLVKPSNTFQQMLSSLREVCADEHSFWSRCSENDGAVADVKIVFSYAGNAFDQLNQLAWIERTDPEETQWGDCHLLLMLFSHDWMFKISNNFNDL
jgi:hypothetical protein